jgi:hypothetical protein
VPKLTALAGCAEGNHGHAGNCRSPKRPTSSHVASMTSAPKKSDPSLPCSLSPFPKKRTQEPPRLCAVAHCAGSSPHRARHREPPLAKPLRTWLGEDRPKTSAARRERPLYPELIDHLALKFIQERLECESTDSRRSSPVKVYLQRSIADAKTMADDPENQWLARGPRISACPPR